MSSNPCNYMELRGRRPLNGRPDYVWLVGHKSACGLRLSLWPIGPTPARSVTWPAPLQLRYAAWGAIQVLYAFAYLNVWLQHVNYQIMTGRKYFLSTMFYLMRVLFFRLNTPYGQLLKGLLHNFCVYAFTLLLYWCAFYVFERMYIVLPFGVIHIIIIIVVVVVLETFSWIKNYQAVMMVATSHIVSPSGQRLSGRVGNHVTQRRAPAVDIESICLAAFRGRLARRWRRAGGRAIACRAVFLTGRPPSLPS